MGRSEVIGDGGCGNGRTRASARPGATLLTKQSILSAGMGAEAHLRAEERCREASKLGGGEDWGGGALAAQPHHPMLDEARDAPLGVCHCADIGVHPILQRTLPVALDKVAHIPTRHPERSPEHAERVLALTSVRLHPCRSTRSNEEYTVCAGLPPTTYVRAY